MIERLTAALADRYRVARELGEGGMATVYLADDLKHDRQVAIKVLKPELAAVIGAERFLAEIRTTANLQHPHILPLFDSGEAGGFLFYVMPYVEGESLRGRMDREKQLGVDEAVSIAGDVAEALDYAHRHDVIHRDIKPANILIHDGNPVVADFGIALAVSAAGGGRMTETGLSLGTPHYMSPEQASADRDLTNRSDIYGLGCVLYEMLAGQPPHTGPSAQSVLVRILTEEPRPLTEERRSVPPHVAAAVSKAIEKLPADRFSTAEEFKEALDDRSFTYTAPMRAATAVTAATRPPADGSTAPLWRRALPWVAAVAGLALGVVGWMGRPGTPEPLATDLDTGSLDLNALLELEIAPDGSALSLWADVDGEPALLARRRDELDFREIVSADVLGPVFSPNGASIAFIDRDDGSIRRVSVDGGPPTTVMEGTEDNHPMQLAWGDDGYIAFWSYGGPGAEPGLYRLPDIGGTPELLLAADRIYSPWPLPGGRGYLVGHLDREAVFLVEQGADSARAIIPEAIHGRYLPTGHILFGRPDGGLHVVPFDLDGLEVTGPSVPVRDDVSARWRQVAFFSVSDDGTLVYARDLAGAERERELVFMDLETGTAERYPLSPRDMSNPRLAPDSRRVAFRMGERGRTDPDVWVYDLELRTSPTRLTSAGGVDGVAWSPSGDRIAISRRLDSRTELLLTSPEDPSSPTPVDLSLPEGARLRVTDWFTPDSLLMSGRIDPLGSDDLWVAPVAGGEPRLYLESESAARFGRVAPSGDHALYVLNSGGDRELVVRSFPDAGEPISIARESDRESSRAWLSQPSWSPTEPIIYYQVRHAGGVDTLFAAHVRFEPDLGLDSTTVEWVQGSPIGTTDPFPDGSGILAIRPVAQDDESEGGEPREPRVIVVTNWFEELWARLEGR